MKYHGRWIKHYDEMACQRPCEIISFAQKLCKRELEIVFAMIERTE